LSFVQNILKGAGNMRPAHEWDSTEGAFAVTALGDFEIGVVGITEALALS
jgi:hypothetical protein